MSAAQAWFLFWMTQTGLTLALVVFTFAQVMPSTVLFVVAALIAIEMAHLNWREVSRVRP